MYNFTDTIAPAGGLPLPAEAMNINGVYIENEIPGYRTLQVEGRELLDSEISDMQIGNSNGTRYRSKRDPSRAITVTYGLQSKTPVEFREKFNKLNQILNQEEAELIFLDEPTKYFTGTKSTVDSVPSGKLNVVSQFTLYCADPYKYTICSSKASNNGQSTITLTNNGTKPTPVNIKTTIKSDNGYIGFTLDDRFYQIGNPEEVDGKKFETTDLLFDDHFTKERGWLLNQGITPPVTPYRDQVSDVRYVVEKPGEGVLGEGYVAPKGYGIGDSWHGPALSKIVPADKNGKYPVNWYSCYRFDFNTDGAPASQKGKQAGHHSVTFSDEKDNIIVSVVFEDNNYSMERSDMVVYIGNKRTWDTRNTTNFYVRGHDGRPGGRAIVIVEKIGNKINVRFSYAGINKTFFTNNPKAQLRKVTYYSAQYKSYSPIQNNLLRAIQVRKHNVYNYEDIPNYFMNGDTLELYSDKNELFINGVKDWDKVDIGSKPLLLPSGTHTLGIITSEWAKVPVVEATWRERYL